MSTNTNELNLFKFEMPITIRWNDLDMLGHVNNIYYFEYFQIARGAYMEQASKTWDWNKHMFVIAHTGCDFKKEITLANKNLFIKTRTSRIANKSFELEYLIYSKLADQTETIHAKGISVNVLIDIKERKGISLPQWLKDELQTYEPISINLGT